ncbi:MAG: hypothetical protein ACK2US_13255, partial [Anaerolineae bacterium]
RDPRWESERSFEFIIRQPREGFGAEFGTRLLSFAQNRGGSGAFRNFRKVTLEQIGFGIDLVLWY